MTINNIVPSLIKSYKGKEIRINPETRYVCLTDMANASGKQVNHWMELKGTTEYLRAFELATGITGETLLHVGEGSTGTWAHQKIAIRFAQWCSPEFAIQVDFWIDDLMSTGSVSIAPLSQMQMIAAMALQIDEQNNQIELIKQQQALEALRIDELAQLTHQHDCEIDRLFSPNGHYFSVVGYARNRGVSIGLERAKEIGGKCSKHCRENEIRIEKLADARFGTVGSYPENVISKYF